MPRIRNLTAKRIYRSIRKRPMTWLVSLYGIVFGLVREAVPDYIPDLNPYLQKPFEWIARWPLAHGPLSLIQFIVFSVPYMAIAGALVLWARIGYMWLRGKREQDLDDVLNLYRDEFAAAVESIDGLTDDSPREAIEELLHAIVETVAVHMGLRKKQFRVLFFTPDPSVTKEQMQSGNEFPLLFYEIGHQFDLARKGRISKDAFQADIDLVYDSLKTDEIEIFHEIEHFRSDAKYVFAARNPGTLRLGMYMAVLKKNIDKEVADELLSQISSFVMTLAFVDAVKDFIVEWNQGGDSNVPTTEAH